MKDIFASFLELLEEILSSIVLNVFYKVSTLIRPNI